MHRLPPECKVAATVLFVFAIVVTPREAFWAFGIYAAVIAALAVSARVPLSTLVRRLALEVPFLAFALFLPFIGRGPQVDVFGLSLSVDGLWGAWNIVVKGTLGVAASSVLVATTDTRDILRGLERLHVPKVFVAVASFMLRYLEVIAGEMRAMRIARLSRGYDPRWIGQTRAIAASAGTLFIRSYERGERVYLRDGRPRLRRRSMPVTIVRAPDAAGSWGIALLLPLAAMRGRGDRVDCRDDASRARHPRSRVRLSRRAPGAVRRRSARRCRGARGAARAERRREDDARAPSQRDPRTDVRHRARRRAPGRQGELQGRPPARRDRVPGPGRPAVHGDGARRCRVRTRELRHHGFRARRPRARGAARGGHGGPTPIGRRTTSASVNAGGSRSRPCS